MSKAEYALLQDVITDEDFPDLDLALRRGRHIDRDDAAWYSLLSDAQELLEPFYRRYSCELIHKTDGYFYLLPTGDKVSRKQLSASDMLVGQALALLYLDPAAVERGGVVTQEEVVGQLSAVLGSDALINLFSPGKRKRPDERIAQRNVRQQVSQAVRRLANLGFVELNDAGAVRLRAALLRFAEPVRGLSEPAEALAKLVAQGEVALTPEGEGDSDDAEEDRIDDDDAEENAAFESEAAAENPTGGLSAALASTDLESAPGAQAHAATSGEDGGSSPVAASDAFDAGVEGRDARAPLHGARVASSAVHEVAIDGRAVESSLLAASETFDAGFEGSDAAAPLDEVRDPNSAAFGGGVAGRDVGALVEAGDVDHEALADDVEAGEAWGEAGDSGVVARPETAGSAAESGESTQEGGAERAVVPTFSRRAPRAADDDLEWADILLPERDAEDGS